MSGEKSGADVTYSITFSAQQLVLVGTALRELPYKYCAPLLQHIQKQVDAIEADKAASHLAPTES